MRLRFQETQKWGLTMSEHDTDEYNVCGVLVHAKTNEIEQVKSLLAEQDGVEVHAVTDNGRLIVTVENEQRKTVGDQIMAFYDVPGVLSASMIYQYSDNDLDSEKFDINNPETGELETSKERMSA